MIESRLEELLSKVEALHARPGTEGERRAAAAARERILARLRAARREIDVDVERCFHLRDEWTCQLFRAVLRRRGLEPFRYRRQRLTTVMVRGPNQVLLDAWAEFKALARHLRAELWGTTERIIAEEVAGPR